MRMPQNNMSATFVSASPSMWHSTRQLTSFGKEQLSSPPQSPHTPFCQRPFRSKVEAYEGSSRQQRQAEARSSGLRSRPAAMLAAGLVALSVTAGPLPAQASILSHVPLAATATATGAPNKQMLDQIHFYQAEQNANSSSKQPASASQLLQAAAVQLSKVETLIGIGQYESARLQLRQGPASTIRLELRKFEQDTWPGDPQAAKAIVGEVESLDAALKKTKSAEECRHLVQQLRHDLIALVGNDAQSNK